MEYCAKCVMPNTIYSLSIDENGICDACRTAEAKKEIDWESACIDIRHGRLMQEEAIELVDKYDGEVVDFFINKNIFEIDEGGNPLNNDQGRLIKKAAFDLSIPE